MFQACELRRARLQQQQQQQAGAATPAAAPATDASDFWRAAAAAAGEGRDAERGLFALAELPLLDADDANLVRCEFVVRARCGMNALSSSLGALLLRVAKGR